MRHKLILGGFETWVEYNEPLCCIKLFGFETAKIPLTLDVMGIKGHKYVSGHSELTAQEKKELNNYINNLVD